MIKSSIIHPELLRALAKCGHRTNILIADSNYSFVTNSSRHASIIYLNLSPGLINSTTILDKVLEYINVETVTLMEYPKNFNNTIEKEYRALLPEGTEINHVTREIFYAFAKSNETLLVIASGETRRFANILLTVAPVIAE